MPGKPLTEEHKRKLAEARKKYWEEYDGSSRKQTQQADISNIVINPLPKIWDYLMKHGIPVSVVKQYIKNTFNAEHSRNLTKSEVDEFAKVVLDKSLKELMLVFNITKEDIKNKRTISEEHRQKIMDALSTKRKEG